MKRYWLPICAILIYCSTAPVFSAWTISHRGDFPMHIRCAAYSPDGTHLVAAGQDGIILRSADGGANFTMIQTSTSKDLNSIAWQNETTIWIAAGDQSGWNSSGALIRSTDTGLTWTTRIDNHTVRLMSVGFLDPLNGWVGKPDSAFLRTTDGGASWADVDITLSDVSTAGLTFLDSTTGFTPESVFAFDLYRTTDGGVNWDDVYSDTLGSIVGITFPSASDGRLASVKQVARSTNGGASWTAVAQHTDAWLYGLDFADPSTGWIAGHHDTIGDYSPLIRKTTDGGISWAEQNIVGATILSGIRAFDATRLAAFGSFGYLFTTGDGGETWERIPETTSENFHRIRMTDAMNGWGVGEPSAIRKTTDGGETWTQIGGVWDNGDLNEILDVDGTTMIAAGTTILLTSSDGGTTWSRMSQVVPYASGIHFTSASTGWIGGRYGIYYTTDGGASWEIQAGMGYGGVYDIEFVSPSVAFAVAGLSTVFRSTDGGQSWQNIHSHGINNYLRALCFADAQHGWAVGEAYPTNEAIILATTDGGASWFAQDSNVDADLYDVYFWNATRGIAVGEGGVILETTNGGASWTGTASPVTSTLRSIEALPGGAVWLAGDWSTLLTEGGTTTPTPAPSATASRTPTATQTIPPTLTPTRTATPSPIATRTPTSTVTPDPTSTGTAIPTSTPTPVNTATASATPTGTGTWTATPSATPSPTQTHTQIPSHTPSQTPTQPPTPTASFTPQPTRTPSATPTTARPLGVRIELPTLTVHPGEEFYVRGYLDNPGAALEDVPVFFVLDVYGSYWFWPSWIPYAPPGSTAIDYQVMDVPSGTETIEVIALFTWPDTGGGSASGIRFYGAMLDETMTGLRGDLAVVTWGYSQ